MRENVKWFGEITIEDVAEVGGKNASLGEMYQNLTQEGVRVPNGFAVTASAYKYVLDYNGAWEKLHEPLLRYGRRLSRSLFCRAKRHLFEYFRRRSAVGCLQKMFGFELHRQVDPL